MVNVQYYLHTTPTASSLGQSDTLASLEHCATEASLPKDSCGSYNCYDS